MAFIDITRTLSPDTTVYPGDPALALDTTEYSLYKTSCLFMCVHTGTHIDAPSHFLLEGDTDGYPLDTLCGPALVISYGEDWLERAKGHERVLIKGGNGLSEAEAKAAVRAGIRLIGTDRLSIAPFDAEMAAHKPLLKANVCILENADLSGAPDGEYRLICLPLKLRGAEGAPVRAVLETL